MASQIQTPTSDPIRAETLESDPYPMSIHDRFMNAVERLPIPYWLTYLLLFILETVLLQIVAWWDGWLAPFSSNPMILLFPLWQWGTYTIITYLDRISLEAISSFAQLLDISPETLRRLKYEFTTIPPRAAIVSALFWDAFFIVFAYFTSETLFAGLGADRFTGACFLGAGLIAYSTGSIIYFHSIRQLMLVHRTVKMVKQFDLFRLDPVYAFSQVTSRTAMAWVILLTLTLLTFPVQLAVIPSVALIVAQILLAVSAFVLPLWTVNHRLVLEKRRLIAEHDRRVQAALARLHHDVDSHELDIMDKLHWAITDLNTEREILLKIPTWPWRAGVLPGFLSVIGLPILTFLIQLAIGRWLGK